MSYCANWNRFSRICKTTSSGRTVNIPEAIYEDSRLTVMQRAVLIEIIRRPKNWRISAGRIARKLGVSTGTVQKALRPLRSIGYVSIVLVRDSSKMRSEYFSFSDPSKNFVEDGSRISMLECEEYSQRIDKIIFDDRSARGTKSECPENAGRVIYQTQQKQQTDTAAGAVSSKAIQTAPEPRTAAGHAMTPREVEKPASGPAVATAGYPEPYSREDADHGSTHATGPNSTDSFTAVLPQKSGSRGVLQTLRPSAQGAARGDGAEVPGRAERRAGSESRGRQDRQKALGGVSCREVNPDTFAALVAAGVSEPTRTWLASDPNLTDAVVNRTAVQLRSRGKGVGILVNELRAASERMTASKRAPETAARPAVDVSEQADRVYQKKYGGTALDAAVIGEGFRRSDQYAVIRQRLIAQHYATATAQAASFA